LRGLWTATFVRGSLECVFGSYFSIIELLIFLLSQPLNITWETLRSWRLFLQVSDSLLTKLFLNIWWTHLFLVRYTPTLFSTFPTRLSSRNSLLGQFLQVNFDWLSFSLLCFHDLSVNICFCNVIVIKLWIIYLKIQVLLK